MVRKMVAKSVKQMMKTKKQVEETCWENEKPLKTFSFYMFFEVPLVPNSQKIDQKIVENLV